MKFITSSVLAAVALASGSNAVELDTPIVGRALPDRYIAKALTTPEGCERLRNAVRTLQTFMDPNDVAARETPARETQIKELCFVSFGGSGALQAEVARLNMVHYVEQEQEGTLMVEPTSWGLDRIDQPSLPLSNEDISTPYTGAGVNIYITDTGINKDHVDFGGRAFLGGNFVQNENEGDRNGHGTHCAGTAAGSTFGIARGARVFGIKVCNSAGRCPTSGILSGIKWAVNDANGRGSVLSMSLGIPRSQSMEDAVQAARASNFIVTVAAGNSNADACSNSPASAGGSGPEGGIISVASSDIADRRSTFSSFGSQCTDIFAPGTNIKSAWFDSATATRTISGTSMATPHVAGVAALLLQKYNGDSVSAQKELFAIAAPNRITDPRGTPNLLLQVPRTAGTPPPVTSPTPAPTRAWRCLDSWFDARDGCDCECGGGDPDCQIPGQRVYCNGQPAGSNVICDISQDACVRVSLGSQSGLLSDEDGETSGESKDANSASGDDAAFDPVPLAAGLAGFSALVLGGVLVVRRRRENGVESTNPKAELAVASGPSDV